MAVPDIFKVSRKTFFNPSAWLDYPGLKNKNIRLYYIFRNFFASAAPLNPETFEEAVVRLALTEEDIQKIRTRYHWRTFLFITVGIVLLGYSFYLLFNFALISGWLLGLAATAFSFAQAFRYDFWALQMSRRQLGLTFEDWKRHVLGEKAP